MSPRPHSEGTASKLQIMIDDIVRYRGIVESTSRVVGHKASVDDSDIDEIFDKYVGNFSRSAILSGQKELIQPGYEGNASW